MKKFWIQFVILGVIIIGSLYLVKQPEILTPIIPSLEGANRVSPNREIKVGEVVVEVEVADTRYKRNQGLSGRESLPVGQGMIFTFSEEKKYQFWMKGMRFPLDFIFIRDGQVIDILKNIPPPSSDQKDSNLPLYEPVTPIDMLLEVNAGFVEQHSIKVGDVVRLIE